MSFPYTLNTGKIAGFLEHIQTAGVPQKFNQTYLQGTEFRSSNDRALIPIMKHLGFVDSSGTPTELWKSYRDRDQAAVVLGDAIRNAYSDLFSMYPNAHRRPVDTIKNFMASKSSVGDKALSSMVATFRALCERADINAESEGAAEAARSTSRESGPASHTVRTRQVQHADAVVKININLTIEPTSDAAVYENFFSAMRKHLIDSDA